MYKDYIGTMMTYECRAFCSLSTIPMEISEKNISSHFLSTDSESVFLGATAGSPYIVFISTSGMLRSSDIYIYIPRKYYNT